MGRWDQIVERLKAAWARKDWRWAMLVAALSDGLSLIAGLTLAPQLVVDFATALTLFILLGWRWKLLPGFIAEAIPAVAVFPTWTLVLLAIGVTEDGKKDLDFPKPPAPGGPPQG